MVTIAVCDDHYQDLQLTKQQIEQIITAHYAGIPHQILLYSSGNALLKDTAILNTIDLLFLDIILPDLSGFEIAARLKKLCHRITIIFLSQCEWEVYKSFQYQPFRFVRKNQDSKNIEAELTEAIQSFIETHLEACHMCAFRYGNRSIFVDSRDILYMTSYNHNLTVVKVSDCFVCRDSIQKRSEELRKYGFIQSHISCLVNMRYIKKIRTYDILMQDDYAIALSRHRKKEIVAVYCQYLQT